MSQDTYTGNPGDPLSLNLYAYVSNNNPLRYFDPTGHGTVPVTLPNGTKTTGNVVNGKTYLSNGDRVPEGSVVSTAGGDFMMKNGSGVKVDPVPVITSSGSKTTGYVASGETYYVGGKRVESGAVVTTGSGTYMMQNGKGVEVTPVSVIAPSIGATTEYLSKADNKTYMAGGSRVPEGSLVLSS